MRSVVELITAKRDGDELNALEIRRLIADYLTLQGMEVVHLIDRDDARTHQLSPEARRESAQLIYDRHVNAELDL